MRILLATPPMTQLNAPYPATTYLTGFLRSKDIETHQIDFSLELALDLFSSKGLRKVFEALKKEKKIKSTPAVRFFIKEFSRYETVADSVLTFLQGKNPTLAHRIVTRTFLPEGARFAHLHQQGADDDWLAFHFGSMGLQDQAKYLASLFIDDLQDVIQQSVEPFFGLARYGESLAESQASFDPLYQALCAPKTVVASSLQDLTVSFLEQSRPDVIALTVPFPGNVYGAFLIAEAAKKWNSKIKVILGGGYVNTELRSLNDSRVFDFVDFITMDDGEIPLFQIIEHLKAPKQQPRLLRTFTRKNNSVSMLNDPTLHDVPLSRTPAPSYAGLDLTRYLSIVEMLNPMHRIWSDGRWLKLTLAHGCYWKKCSFCDTSLDYIGRYDPASVDSIIDRMQTLIAETGLTGFHFVDEAAPPALLRALSQRLIEKKLTVTWWTNIRFEKTFTPDLCELMAQAGCIAVTGGLEVASDRLLKLMQKGVTVKQVARVARSFSRAHIMVHAYLMYGFPTQTVQETVDALEVVRQFFESGTLHSAFWHRFVATVHSPVGKNPSDYSIELMQQKNQPLFAENDVGFHDSTKCDHELLGKGLRKALYNFMHGSGFEKPVHQWFETRVPQTSIKHAILKN